MAGLSYIQGRKRFSGRPQAMLWADNQGTIIDGHHVPLGTEVGADVYGVLPAQEPGEFIILTDHNRDAIDFKPTRIEQRKRMINGRMRAYHVADKLTISTSWTNVPSRSYSSAPEFATTGESVGKSPLQYNSGAEYVNNGNAEYTADGGAGGVEILDWYENHQGSFWVYLSYDKYDNFGKDASAFQNLNKYSQLVEVFFSEFNYKVVTRGQYDFWDISVTLEEV